MPSDLTWAAGLHWAFAQRAWFGLFQQYPDGLVVCRHELTWFNHVPEDAADDIKRLLTSKAIDRLQFLALDPKCFPKLDDSGRRARVQTVSMTLADAGLPVKRGHEDWPAAWQRVRAWLVPRQRAGLPTPLPLLRVHEDCDYLIRTLPVVVASEADPDIADETEESIPARGLSYYVMAKPAPIRPAAPGLPPYAIGREVQKLRDEIDGR
jgi:hypothetical protein